MNAREERGSWITRWIARTGVGRLLALTIGVVLLLATLGIALALVANGQLTHNRHLLLDEVGPARRTALVLENALINEETGVRGLALTGESSFLEPYDGGLQAERRAYRELEGHAQTVGPPVGAGVAKVRAAAGAWRGGYVAPTLIQPSISKRQSIALDLRGKRLFDVVRASLTSLVRTLDAKSTHARANLASAADTLQTLLILAGALILGAVLAAGFILRRTVTRPLTRLGNEARRVAAGEFAKPLLVQDGPREIVEVGAEIDTMRERIVEELAAVEGARVRLEEQALEQRLHSREAYEGSGIGLALCRKIVEYHGGTMWLDSEFSGGARFRFTLPVDEGA